MKRKLTYESDEETTSSVDKYISEVEYGTKLFEPIHFLRCHSRTNDPADVQTQVWQCAFEPDVDCPGRNTNIVATCGGNSACFIDAVTGNVVSKFYTEKPTILLYSLAWTTIHPGAGRRCNILAVGGTNCYLQLLFPGKKCSLLSSTQSLIPPSTGKQKGKDILSFIVFHPTRRSILFCSASTGGVAAWDIANCHPWSDSPEPKLPQLLLSFTAHSEVFSLSISKNLNFLLSGCNSGLFGWSLERIDWDKKASSQRRLLSCIEFELPGPDDEAPVKKVDNAEESLVDSVVCIPGSSLVATKCALRGVIYIWDLKDTIEKLDSSSKGKLGFKEAKLRISPVRLLRWSDTDDYFMSMGCTPDGKLLACGDDEGGVWLYNLDFNLKERKAKKARIDVSEGTLTEPQQRLLWPSKLEDPEVQNARKVKRLEGHGGVIDQVSLSVGQNGSIHLAAVTSTNLVCIWRAFDEGDIQDPRYSFE